MIADDIISTIIIHYLPLNVSSLLSNGEMDRDV